MTSGISEGVQIERRGSVGVVTFESEKANALSSNLLRQLILALQECDRDDAVRTIVIQSGGSKSFCAGAYFGELEQVTSLVDAEEFFSGFARLLLALKGLTKFVTARVQGKAVGGGVGLVAGCDTAFAAESAALRLSEFALGIGPFVIGPAVERKIGLSAFSHLAVSADWVDAHWAHAKGLYQEVFSTQEALESRVFTHAEQLARNDPRATRELRAALWSNTQDWSALLFDRARVSGSLWISKHLTRPSN